jgi:putative acetyltransferase
MDETFPPSAGVEVLLVSAATADVSALVSELDQELSTHYSPEQRHGISLSAIFQPHIRFFVAYTNGRAAGCGGVALFPNFAEVKRMYVRKESRGHGVADTILARLKRETLDADLTVLRLEAGMHSAAALRFYRRSGFQPCQAFEPYASMAPQAIATSVFLEKQLRAL